MARRLDIEPRHKTFDFSGLDSAFHPQTERRAEVVADLIRHPGESWVNPNGRVRARWPTVHGDEKAAEGE